jgi:4-hydroxy-tetrahydrodipicolinate reductase
VLTRDGALTKIAIAGIAGRMGRASARAILAEKDLVLVGGFDQPGNAFVGKDIGVLSGSEDHKTGILVSNDFKACVAGVVPDVLLDFTRADAAFANGCLALEHGISPVIGTSGLNQKQIEELKEISKSKQIPGLVVPNFSVGAVLMMEFARQAAQMFNDTEIVEMHHTGKADAPSGTAMHTLKKMAQGKKFNPPRVDEKELMPGARGAKADSGIRVHSLRLPGLISHQEVIFGSEGELLRITHDSFTTDCFTKGILLALHSVRSLSEFLVGLDNILPMAGSPAARQ